MADIQTYLDAIENAVYGEDVRGSIHDAIEIINDVGEKVITAGTAVTSPSSSVEGFFDDSLYFNINTDDLWQCNGTGWTLLGNLKGSQGNPGNPGQAATIAVGTVTKGDNASVVNSGTSSAAVFDFVLPKGDPGPAGANTWGSITGDIDDQTDLKNALEDVYDQSEELVDRTVGWVCNNLFNIEAVEMGKDIYGEAAANSALFTLNCKPSTRYYLSVHGTNNLQVSYNTTALGPTEVLIASFPYDFLTTQYDTYIKICFTKSGITKSDIEALQFMLTEVANAPYSEYHPPVSDVITDVYGVMGENGAKNVLLNKATSTSVHGVIVTVNADKSITLNGKYEHNSYSAISIVNTDEEYSSFLYGKTWKASCKNANNKVQLQVYNYDGSNAQFSISNDNDREFTWTRTSGAYAINILIPATSDGYTFDNLTLYPMFRDARDTNPDFEPYAMTNRELTEKVTPIEGTITSDFTVESSQTKLVKIGKLVIANIYISGVTKDAFTNSLFNIPEGFRPTLSTGVAIPMIIGNNTIGRCTIVSASGNAQSSVGISNQNIFVSGTWITD